jgi:hypothetical protein
VSRSESKNAKPAKAPAAQRKAERAVMPDVAAAAALNFLKETKGALTWTTQEFARGVGIKVAVAGAALAVLQMQGYVKPGNGKDEWMTTVDGDAVSGGRSPRFNAATVKQALQELRARIQAANKDVKAEFKVVKAVAFGDFLADGSRAQAADVGIELVSRNASKVRKAKPKARERAFLKALRGANQTVRLVAFEPWMRERAHLRLV